MSSSIDAIRARLDSNLQSSMKTLDYTGRTMDAASADDWSLYLQANRQLAVDSWAAKEELRISHGLMKAIIDQIR